MKHRRRVAFSLTSICVVALCWTTARADLSGDVRAVLRDKSLAKCEVGVEIARLRSGSSPEILFKHNSDIPLIPASNLKLVTTSAALETLGADFKFRTVLALRDRDLLIIGDGDPTIGDFELLKKSGWDVDTLFRNWSDLLKAKGIKSVRNVIVDDSVFDDEFVHPTWPEKQQHLNYVAGVGGLNLNTNCIDFYLSTGAAGARVSYRADPPTKYATVTNDCVTGRENAIWLSRVIGTNNIELRGEASVSSVQPVRVTVHDPPLFAATVLAETLAGCGVKVSGTVVRDRTIRQSKPKDLDVLAVHETPLLTVLARANKHSVNLYAEALCKRVGFEISHLPGSWESGTVAMSSFVSSCGVADDQFNFADGGGLSRKNAVSANALVRVLAHNFAGKSRELFISSLAVSGAEGTLDNRFRNSDIQGRVFAKSGYVIGVSALSGYLKAKDGQWYAFSIIMNGVTDTSTAKQLQEKIVRAIDSTGAARVTAGQ
ncbi:MAG: D-alanyl-D-alanine carboxypeptidase/D-alanyl-D-alanine endopeptidase [Tepidisphaeraceae bacterium]